MTGIHYAHHTRLGTGSEWSWPRPACGFLGLGFHRTQKHPLLPRSSQIALGVAVIRHIPSMVFSFSGSCQSGQRLQKPRLSYQRLRKRKKTLAQEERTAQSPLCVRVVSFLPISLTP